MAVEHDIKHALADSLGLLAVLEQRPRTAARLRGYADALHASYGTVREPNEARTVERTERLTHEQLGDAEFGRLTREGSMLGDEEMVTMALSTEDTEAARP